LLPRADLFLVGNRRQGDLLLPLLLQAGFDCRQHVPIAIVPISVRGGAAVPAEAPPGPLRLINAGVDWPWRQTGAYREALLDLCRNNDKLEFIEYRGGYPGAGHPDDRSSLLSYADMQAALLAGHIGLEVGERNTEREFSHSFRAMEYLECGLPVIINAWIPLAETIRQYDAGWVIDDPAALAPLLQDLLADPAQL
jgi:glycosyltransferase involved in cell wall biosynthesis